jgi:DNA-binding CsgD family transcriptional regulator
MNSHITALYRLLGVSSRGELMSYFLRARPQPAPTSTSAT